MFDTEQTDHGILGAIQTVANNGESGRLAMRTGSVDGAFFFNNGLLVDARVGNLTGFQAINAAASMRGASLSFDPSVAPPHFSSIRPNERVILKQFFGIDTIAPEDDVEQVMPEEYDEVTLAVPVAAPLDAVPASSNVHSSEVPTVLPYPAASSSFLRGGLMIALLLVLLAVTGVALLYSFGGRPAPVSTAAAAQPPAPPVTEKVEPTKQVETAKQIAPNKVEAKKETTAIKATDTPAIKKESATARDLTGKWNVINTVSQTSFRSFDNMQIGFNLSIEQNGKGFTGTGQKVSENGRTLPASSRTPIQVKGTIDGDRVEATFYEQGTVRKSNGRFVWTIDRTGRLTGTFNSTVARSSGKSTARKV
jgi:hypothetical protein